MKKHRNPYRIQDERNLFEVTANSSHPELNDSKRVWHFRGYTFTSPERLQDFFNNEGLNPAHYWYKPVMMPDGFSGANIIHLYICERIPQDERHQPHYSYEELHGKAQ